LLNECELYCWAADAKVEKCVAKAAAKMKSGMDGECAAYFLIGAEAGAKAAYDKAKAGKEGRPTCSPRIRRARARR
jgi:hypothetical protein